MAARLRITFAWVALTCALSGPAVAGAAPRIAGGTDSTRAWPSMASVWLSVSRGTNLCGGTLIASRWVLTAAHCFDDKPHKTVVVLGGRTLSDTAATAIAGAEVDLYDGYEPSTFAGDLALIRLQKPSDAAPQPLAGPVDQPLSAPGAAATILGWGAVTEGGGVSLTRPLQQAEVPVGSDADCRRAYGAHFLAAVMLCAGRPTGGVDTCQGDSGGPLLVGPALEALRLAGVTSWGEGCARAGRPGVYVRLQDPGIQKWVRDRVALDGFSVSPASPAPGQPVLLTSTASSPPEEPGITALDWDLDGDGAFDDATGVSARAAFAQEGRPEVRLRVTRGQDEATVFTGAVVVRSGGSAPAAETPPPPGPGVPSSPAAVASPVASGVPAGPAPAPPPAGTPPSGPPLPPAAPRPVMSLPRPAPRPVAHAAPRARLRILATARGTSRARSYTLRCGPTGGTWPARETACERLLAAGGVALLARPAGGSPGRPALGLTGVVDGRRVTLRLRSRGSSAVRARFAAVRRLLGAAAVDRALRSSRRP